MSESQTKDTPKILILATASCGYPGADATGQGHLGYPANTYVVKIPSPAALPEQFYYECFDKGVGGIIVMACGVECPFVGAYERLSARIDRISLGLRERGIDQRRLKLSAICTVCTKAFMREVLEMDEFLKGQAVESP